MTFDRDADPALLYDDLRRTFLSLVADLTPEQRSRTVPATPAWSVMDVVAHVVGITADLNAGRLGADISPDEWTDAQVRSRRGRTVVQLAAEWDLEAPAFVDGLRIFGYSIGAHYVGDLLQHVGDVRHALGLPPPADDLTLAVATDFYLESLGEGLVAAGVGSVDVRAGDETHRCGDGATVAAFGGSRYEVFRALGGRRSDAQIRRLAWEGDADRIVPLVSRYPLPLADIDEPGAA